VNEITIIVIVIKIVIIIILIIIIIIIIDIYIAPIQICSKRFTKVKELKRKFYEIKDTTAIFKINSVLLQVSRTVSAVTCNVSSLCCLKMCLIYTIPGISGPKSNTVALL